MSGSKGLAPETGTLRSEARGCSEPCGGEQSRSIARALSLSLFSLLGGLLAAPVPAQAPFSQSAAAPPPGATPGPTVQSGGFNQMPNLPPLTKQQRTEILAAMRDILAANYVDPTRRVQIVAELAKREREGKFDIDHPLAFASRVTRDLREIGKDKHLSLMFHPQMSADPGLGNRTEAAAAAGMAEERTQEARRANHGIREMRIFPGNIRYLRLQSFAHWAGEESLRAYERAMRFLAEGDAIIIDVRGNEGGQPDGSTYFLSHFVEPNSLLYTEYNRGKKIAEFRSAANVPAGSLLGKPLYVLTNAGSVSSAEIIPYEVRNRKLGLTVGTTTAGAGNLFEGLRLPHGFVAGVSVGGPVFAATGKNWDGVGVAPDIEVPSEIALETALLHASERLAANLPPMRKALADKEIQKLRGEINTFQNSPRPAGLGAAMARHDFSVTQIMPGGTGEAIGMKEGDIPVGFGGKPVSRETFLDVMGAYVSSLKVGDPITVTVRRGGQDIELSGKARARPESQQAAPTW